MSTQANIFEEGFENVQERFRDAGDELKKFQKRAEKNRRDVSKRAQKRAEKVQKQLLDIPVIKKAEDLRTDFVKQVEANVDEFISRIPLASANEIKKLERKVNALTRKVRALEKAKA